MKFYFKDWSFPKEGVSSYLKKYQVIKKAGIDLFGKREAPIRKRSDQKLFNKTATEVDF